MERSVRLTWIQRALAPALLVPVLWAAKLEWRSQVATAVREGKPWACWLALKAPADALPQLFLAYYRPRARTLDVIYVPENDHLDGKKTLAQLAAAARKSGARTDAELAGAMTDAAADAVAASAPPALRDALAAAPRRFEDFSPEDDDPPLAAKDWLRAQLRVGALVRRLSRGPRTAVDLVGFELFRAGLELSKLSEDQLRAAYLPDDPADRAAYLSRLDEAAAAPVPTTPAAGASGPGGEERPTTVEILNATAKSGIANTVKKILRSRGADVMSTGNAPARARTLVVDRVGRPELAARVRHMLDCPSAQTVTQVDEKRLVDVSVVVADDCALKE